MKREILITGDGSTTIRIPDWDENYHSSHGAIQEAKHVFIANGLDLFQHLGELSILEIGFGTGLNAFITFLETQYKSKVNYVGIEAYPVSAVELAHMNYVSELNASQYASIFEQMHLTPWEQEIAITSQFKLTKRNHKVSTTYGAIETELQHQNIKNPTLKDVSNAVIAIRQSKLPDPRELGNSGSFFKNPIISKEAYEKAKTHHPEIPHYVISESEVKVPAGWLIEQAGFKGKRFGDAGVHKNQALVLVNYGTATGAEIVALSKRIQQTILEKFGIAIEAEVNII